MKKLQILPYALFFIAFYVLLLPIQLRVGSDDTAHIEAIDSMGVLDWVLMRAKEWQPRIFGDMGFAVFLFRLPLWKVLGAICMTLLLALCAKIGAPKKTFAFGLAPLLFFLIHPNVITSGSVWYCGSFYYLFPILAMLIGLLPFVFAYFSETPRSLRFCLPISFVCAFCAAWGEQTAAVQIGIAGLLIIAMLISKKKIRIALWALFGLIFVCGLVFFALDFVAPRATTANELSLFPEFANFSFADKFALALNVYDEHLLHQSNILFLILSIGVGFCAFLNFKGWKRFFAFVPALYVFVNALPFSVWEYTKNSKGFIGREGVFSFSTHSPLSFLHEAPPMGESFSGGAVLLAALGFVCVAAVGFVLYKAFPKRRNGFFALVLYAAAFGSGAVIGFSPSIWASESRPFFLSNFLLLTILVMLIAKTNIYVIASEQCKTSSLRGLHGTASRGNPVMAKYLRIVGVALLAAFAIYVYILYKTTFATNTYWWY